MSGRFPKCLTPGCRRLLIKKTGIQQLTCGGCRQTYHVADLAEQNVSLKKNTSDVSSEQQQNNSQPNTLLSDDDDMRRLPIRTSTYPSVHQKYPNVPESLNGLNRNSSVSSLGSEDYARFGSEEYVTEREQGTRLEKTIVPTRRPSSYNPSISSRSISSDEGGSTISRNRNAISMRTHRRGVSTASTDESVSEIQIRDENLRDDSNEDGKIRPGFIKTNYPPNESKLNQQAGRFHGRMISEEENEEREQDYAINGNFPYQRGRGLNSSFDETTYSRNRDFPFGYKSNSAQESEGTKPVFSESNYSLKQPNINLNVQGDLIDDCSSTRGSIVSEEEFEERVHRSGRNSIASFEGSISSRSFSSDEGGSRMGIGETRFNSRRTYRPPGSRSDNTYDSTYSATQFDGVEKTSIPSQQNELNDLVKELTIMGITREKLLLSILKQTETSINENLMHQNRNTRSLVRKLSVQIPLSPPVSDSGSSRGSRRPAMHHCRPVLGGTPFITCSSCSMLLQLPIGMPTQKLVKIRCGECSGTQVCPFPAKGANYNPLHKALGYESARFLMAPSFSVTDDDTLN